MFDVHPVQVFGKQTQIKKALGKVVSNSIIYKRLCYQNSTLLKIDLAKTIKGNVDGICIVNLNSAR